MGEDLTENRSNICGCCKWFLPPKGGFLNLLIGKTVFWFRKIFMSTFPPVAPGEDLSAVESPEC